MSEIDILHPTSENHEPKPAEWAESPSSNGSDSTQEAPDVWKNILDEYNKDRAELDSYLEGKNGTDARVTLEQLPLVVELNHALFPVLRQGLVEMLETVREETSYYRPKSAFNGIDFLGEFLYNMNPRYPERKQTWTYIFDLEWAKALLDVHPRPFYPFSLIWSRGYAALKIQAFMRGYWVRRRTDVQEVRNFWKAYKMTKQG